MNETENPKIENSHSQDEHGSLNGYLMVFAGLLLLTGISFLVANSPLMSNPTVGWTIMMVVSVAKALLVALFFMHLLHERAWKYVLTIPAMIMAVILVTMLIPDIGMRVKHYSTYRANNAPAAEDVSPIEIENGVEQE
jgi:cytochrome c oxidase subunit 4